MGQKVNPIGFRIGLTQTWRSRWFAEGKKYTEFLEEDIKIRKYIRNNLQRAAISKIEIERANKSLSIEINTARPGIVIGKAGSEVDRLKSDLEKLIKKDIQISVKEIRRPELDAVLLAQNVAEQLVGRVPFRRAMKRAVSAAMKSGAKGVKIAAAGRLGGHEMARTEWYREGRVPLHTLKADIDYGYANARTTFGSIGVKVWIYRGDVLPGVSDEEEKATLKRKLERIQAEKEAARKIEEEDLKRMEEAVKAESREAEKTEQEEEITQGKEKSQKTEEKTEETKDEKKPEEKVKAEEKKETESKAKAKKTTAKQIKKEEKAEVKKDKKPKKEAESKEKTKKAEEKENLTKTKKSAGKAKTKKITVDKKEDKTEKEEKIKKSVTKKKEEDSTKSKSKTKEEKK